MASFLDLGSVIAEVFTFLAPTDQLKLRSTTSTLCQWFDSAAENGSLPFYADSNTGLRWKHAPFNPKSTANPAVVTANVRNYYFSTLNTHSQANEAVPKPELNAVDEYASTDVAVHSFILQGLNAQKLIVTGLNGIKSIEKRFCEKVTASEIVYEGGANQLESVSMHWMLRCPNLVTVTFAGEFPKLKKVDNCWMAECPKLTTVDFKGITALEEVRDRWMFNSPEITNVDFTPFAGSLRSVGCCWLGHATKIENLPAKFEALTKVTEVNTPGQFAPNGLKKFAEGKAPKKTEE